MHSFYIQLSDFVPLKNGFFIVSAHKLVNITLMTLLHCSSKGESPSYILNAPAVAPEAYQVILERYRSVSWVRIPPSAYSYKFVGTFSCAQIDLRKTRKRELATLDETSTSSVLKPLT